MKPLRVLHLEDSEADALLVKLALQKGGFDLTLRREWTAAGFIRALESGNWNVILSDHEMGGFGSAEAFEIYRRFGSDCPILLVSGHIGEEQAAEAMRQGVNDYVLKDHLARLVPAVERALGDAELAKETRRLQKELQERARELELFVRHAPAAIAMLDPSLRYIAVSERWRSDFRLGDVSLAGRLHYDIFPDTPDRWKEVHKRCLAGATEHNDEDRYDRADGTVQWLRWEVRPWRESSNRIGGIFIYSEDITERMDARHALQQNERMLSLGQSLAHVGTFWRDLKTNRLMGTDEAFRILGPGSREILAKNDNMVPFIHPEDLPIYERTRRESRESETLRTHEFRIVQANGAIRNIRTDAKLVRDSANRPTGTIRVIQDITEQKAAETQIREKEWMLSRAQEAGQIGTWFWNKDTARMTLSDQTYRILGIEPKGWAHTIEAYRQLLHPDDRDTFEFHRMVRREDLGGRFADDYRIIRPDGTIRYVTHVGEFFVDDHGHLKGLIGILQDITDRKQIETQLQEKEWMLTRAQEAGNIGTWYLDLRNGARSASPQTYAICGLEAGNLASDFDGFSSIIVPEEAVAFAEARQRLHEDGVPFAGDFHIARRDGDIRSVHIIGNRLTDPAGRPMATIGIIQDITERKRAEAELRSSQQLLRTVVDAIPHAISLRDLEGRYVFANRAWSEWVGYSQEQAVGMRIDEVATRDPADNALILARDQDAIRTGELQVFQRRERAQGSSTRYLKDIRAPVFDGNKVPTGVVGISVDITAEREAEEDLREKQALLDRAQEVARLGVWYRNFVTNEVRWSDELYRLHGVTRDTFSLDFGSVINLVHPEDRAAFIDSRQRVAAERGRFEEDHRIIKPSGEIRYMHVVGECIRGENGEQVAMMGVTQDVTDHHLAQQELREQQWILSRGQEIAHVGSWFRDLKTGTGRWSDELCRIWGIPVDSVALPIEEMLALIHPEDRERYGKLRLEHIREAQGFSVEHRIVRPSGETRYVHVTGQTVNDASGDPIALIGITQDVTDRHRADKEMLEKDWILSRAQEVAQLGTWYRDVRSKVLQWSDDFYRIVGLHPQKHPPSFKTFLNLISKEDQRAFLAARDRMNTDGSRLEQEMRIIRPDGAERWLHVVAQTVMGPDGSSSAFISIVQDITDRKAAEAELVETEWLLSRAQQVAHIGTFFRDRTSGHLKWSDELYRICGVDPATFVPTVESYVELLHPEDRAAFHANRERLLTGGGQIIEESRIIRPDKQVRNVLLILEQAHDNAGKAIGVIGILQDITDRKINEGRLVQAQKLEAIGRLTSGVSHDFNNLLTIINGNLELIRRDLPPGTSVMPMLDTVLKATNRGADLIRQMSSFNRKRPVTQRVVSPLEAIDNVGRLVPRTLGETIEVITSCEPTIWSIGADGAQLESALVNMAINARDAMPNGGKLAISVDNITLDGTGEAHLAGDYVLFTVADTGSGIPADMLDKIFEPFFTTKSQGKGSGLGLSMVFGFVKQSGGHMQVYSQVGAGTTFRLYFPRHVRVAKVELPAPGIPAAPLNLSHLGPVLIVEDQEAIRNLAVNIFGRLGFRAIAVPDAKEGLRQIEMNKDIALLFSDMMLPGGTSGGKLAESVLELRPNLPILLTSGLAEETVELGELESRGVLFQEKPYQFHDIEMKVRELFASPPSSSHAAKADAPRHTH